MYTDPEDQIEQIKKLLRTAATLNVYDTHCSLEYHITGAEAEDPRSTSGEDQEKCGDCGRRKHHQAEVQWTSETRAARIEVLLAQYEGKSADEWYELLTRGASDALNDTHTIFREG